ncbi:type II toxin-antitoxin system RelE/ParE family toxin [Streptomyces sp. NEAU-YJ-81]|uniref:type II toxin-antitoxin system RelE/ParE family toxin n=1 Tax=Streptomyces sp. NEAU-YJ-81 TaxID=2820288 RepID=UPI0027E117F9|nr:type II toxin-antitoxin system RelE/ParE family toxin [Streptomyces sp. NEAU-YJ-81]
MRILFVFDPDRECILLVAGDKAGSWRRWYDTAVPLGEERYRQYLDHKEKAAE